MQRESCKRLQSLAGSTVGQCGPLLAAALRETMINEKHSKKVMRRQPAQHRCLCLLPTTINPDCSFYM